jgi:hypothetical protein
MLVTSQRLLCCTLPSWHRVSVSVPLRSSSAHLCVSRTIIGPVIGGYLAEPVKKNSFLLRPDTIWTQFPLLPNVIVVIFLLSSCTLGWLTLEEVQPQFRGRNDKGREVSAAIYNLLTGQNRRDPMSDYSAVSMGDDDIELHNSTTTNNHTRDLRSMNRWPAFTNQVMLQIFSSAILGFLKIATLAAIPVFLAIPSQSNKSTKVESVEASHTLLMLLTASGSTPRA